MKNFRKDGRYDEGVIDFIQRVKGLPEDKRIKECEQFCSFNSSILMQINAAVQGIKNDINLEMTCFLVEVSHQGRSQLLQITQVLLTWLLTIVEAVMIQKPMYEFEKTKEMEKRIFEAKMTGNNHALDKQLAKRLITSML